MRVIIDESAWRDLQGITVWIGRDNPSASRHEVEKIRHVIGLLADFPDMARTGRVHGTWERVVAGSRSIIVFEKWQNPRALVIVGIVHGARHC